MLRTAVPLLLATALLVAITGLSACEEPEPASERPAARQVEFRNDGQLTFYRDGDVDIITIDIEIAETEEAIRRGLMGRQSLPPRSGMLFLMPQTRIHSFWMANTPLALDITFIGPDSTVINTAKYTRPFTSESHQSAAPARFVVETPAGFTDSHGIIPGDRVRWTRR